MAGLFVSAGLLAGCGGAPSTPHTGTSLSTTSSSDTEITFGSARPSGKIAVSVQPDGSVAASDWPDTCGVLTDQELLAILPQATNIERHSEAVSIRDPSTLALTGVLPKGECDYILELPASSPGKRSLVLGPSVGITIPVISTRAAVTLYYERQMEADHGSPVDLNAAGIQCFNFTNVSEPAIACHSNQLYFEVSGSHPRVKPDEVWRDKVLSEVIRTLAAKLA
ncbi:hypothetical protein OG203_44400 [Nocardia sp. NBC_01499]|uniref:hypothetical protein n=1 Tax=Nocardia sp. NBC_01499 TaxID=2903597 RepID=UPI0038697A7D